MHESFQVGEIIIGRKKEISSGCNVVKCVVKAWEWKQMQSLLDVTSQWVTYYYY